jgi:predicted ester cyclase
MSRTDQVRQSIEALNARDFTAAGKDFSDKVTFHAPGLGLDVEGRETMLEKIGDFIAAADTRYEVADVIEHGPFVVAFARSTGTIEGQRMAWEICEVLRFEGDQAAEVWALRGGAPAPA